MKSDVQEGKSRLRTRMRDGLRSLASDQRDRDSLRITTRLLAHPAIAEARCILGYVALPGEPDLDSLAQSARAAGKSWCLPRWDADSGEYTPAELLPGSRLVPGPFGVPEPPADAPSVAWERLDLILVPGLAFDRRGGRLGRGRGFYDRLLARARHARKWGVAFARQIVAEVPYEPHDANLDALVTPDSWYPVGPTSQT